MRYEFKLPDIGEGMVEGEIVKWHVKIGDTISADEPMLDVMTDKATVTISAPRKGKVLELGAKEGEVKKVGTVLFVLETQENDVPLKQQDAPKNGGRTKTEEINIPNKTQESGVKVLATPATRRLAQELGVNLSTVQGSGPGGRVTQEDVKQSQGVSEKISFTPVSSGSREERVPFRGLRRKIADKMVASKAAIPHFTYVEEADVSQLVSWRDKGDADATAKGIRLTYLPIIIKATVQALKKFPTLNSVLDESKQELVIKHYYNIGVGAATPEGLTVPVVKSADQKTIFQLAKEINELGDKARAGKLSLDELQGSTFTITSLGPLGGILATPIINHPEVAILGIHKIEKRPVVRDNQIVIRDMMYVSLSFDHRVIDGDVGARFANEVIKYLQDPALLLLS